MLTSKKRPHKRPRFAIIVACLLTMLGLGGAVLLTTLLTTAHINALWERVCMVAGSYKEGTTVLFGDSILEEISMPRRFGLAPIKNKSLSGRLATQAFSAFTQSIGPDTKVVIILLGTNDLGKKIVQEEILSSLKEMADYATSRDIHVGICSILPTRGNHAVVRGNKILTTNSSLKTSCIDSGNTYIDLYDEFVDQNGLLKEALSRDGLHLNDEGKELLSSLLKKAIRKVTGGPG